MSRRVRYRYSVAVIVLVTAAMCVAIVVNVGYTRHLQRDGDQRWCALLATLDQPETPPTTERGREIQREIHDLRTELGCDQ